MMDINGIPLSALLRRPGEAAFSDRRGLPEAQVARLREMAERYGAPNPFRAGDLVTPRRDASCFGAGNAHIVIETIPGELSPSGHTVCSLKRFDTRIAWITEDGDIGSAWVESFELERWPTDAGAPPAAADPAAAA